MQEIKLLSLEIQDFKGVIHKKYDFCGNAIISGKNGLGKTTIADAFYWLLFDKNYELFSNHGIRPNDGRECTPTVTLEIELNGNKMVLSKMQKCKKSKPDEKGNVKITLSNTYEINSVEKTERDFKKYLEEKGIDISKFLWLTHPSAFTNGMGNKKDRDQMRDILFGMATSMTDLQIARMNDGISKLAALLESYTLNEVEAMQKSTLRKIKENYGSEGEIILSKIAGLELAKQRIDISDAELEKAHFKELLEENLKKQTDVNALYDDVRKKSQEVLDLKFKLGDLQRTANDDLENKKSEMRSEITSLDCNLNFVSGCIAGTEIAISSLESNKSKFMERLDKAKSDYIATSNSKFDESKLVCSLCGQPLPEDDVEKLKKEFKERKTATLSELSASGEKYKNAVTECDEEIAKKSKEKEDYLQKKEELQKKLDDLKQKLSEIPESVDISGTEEYKQLVSEIKEKEDSVKKFNSVDSVVSELKEEENKIREKISEIEIKIAKSTNDDAIEEKIQQLREKQNEYEQSKADCEKILEQIKQLGKLKNEMLTEQVNANFRIVKWKFFDYQKNGEYKEVCIPTINGKLFGECTNTGLEVLARLDIVQGLQKFYGFCYPVFLDNAECLDSDSKSKIDVDFQLIMLCVSDDSELVQKNISRKSDDDFWEKMKEREDFFKGV